MEQNRSITKYVNQDFFDDTKNGFIKFGTLGEYRSLENSNENRFSDSSEGVAALSVPAGKKLSFTLNTNRYSNCTFENVKDAVRIEHRHDADVFCSKAGQYNSNHHHLMMNKGNETLTHYVVFQLDAFFEACQHLASCLNHKSLLIMDLITYQTRDKVFHPDGNLDYDPYMDEKFMADMSKRVLFHKPIGYKHEEEYRIAICPRKLPNNKDLVPLFTKSFSPMVAEKFKEAVVAYSH